VVNRRFGVNPSLLDKSPARSPGGHRVADLGGRPVEFSHLDEAALGLRRGCSRYRDLNAALNIRMICACRD
jgi:hypothetical protein